MNSKIKKQIVFLEPFNEVMTYKIARIFKKKDYKTISIRLLENRGISDDLFKDAYDEILSLNLKFFKLKLKNIPLILFFLTKKAAHIFKKLKKIKNLKPYVIIGRAQPNWSIALMRYFFKKYPLIYFPYDLGALSDKESVKIHGIKEFERKAEKYNFENSDGIIHMGGVDEIDYVRTVRKDIKMISNEFHFNPYCSKDFIVPLNKNKLSKDGEIHIVNVSSSGSPKSGNPAGFILSYAKALAEQKIHLHLYIKPNTSSFEEVKNAIMKQSRDIIKSKYFHLHKPVNPKELPNEISKYDFGLWLYTFQDLPQEKKHDSAEAKFVTGNKITSYLEAGIPLFYSSNFEYADKLLKKYGLSFPLRSIKDVKKIKKIIKSLNYSQIEKKVIKAREALLMENQFPKLEKFIIKTANKKNSV